MRSHGYVCAACNSRYTAPALTRPATLPTLRFPLRRTGLFAVYPRLLPTRTHALRLRHTPRYIRYTPHAFLLVYSGFTV